MNKNNTRVPTEFAPETRFEIRPASPPPFRGAVETELERLKKQLLRERLEAATELEANGYLRRAANEAAALAWVTAYPLLLFPALFEEKADAALLQAERQEIILQRSRELLTV